MFQRKFDILESTCADDTSSAQPEDSSPIQFGAPFQGELLGGKLATSWSSVRSPLRSAKMGSAAAKPRLTTELRPVTSPVSTSTVMVLEAAISALEQSLFSPRCHPVPEMISESCAILQVLEDSDNGKLCKKAIEKLEGKVRNALKTVSETNTDSNLSPEAIFDAYHQLAQVQAVYQSLEAVSRNLRELRLTDTCWSRAVGSGQLSNASLAKVYAAACEAEKTLNVLEGTVVSLEQVVDSFVDETTTMMDDFQSQVDEHVR